MIYIATGSFGFLILQLFAVISLKRIPGAKPGTWILGNGLIAYALVELCLNSQKLLLPEWSTWLGWGLFSISLLLLASSLFINLPFRRTYIATISEDKLVTTGLYALVRHPWVHGFIVLLFSLFLISKSTLLLIASPMWISLCILLVAFQDRFLFGRMFAEYDSYRQKTPMLLPNRGSVSAFISSLRRDRNQ